MCFWREKFGHPRHLGGRFAFKRQVVAKCNSCCCCFLSAFFNIMSRPHFCNYCKNHGVVTRISHGHAKNCPWRECVCALCMRTRNRNLYRRSLNKRSHEPAGPSSDMTVESSQSLASTSVANVLSAVNAIPPARTPTSCAAARAGKCLYFVVKMLRYCHYFYTCSQSILPKLIFLRCIKPKRGSVTIVLRLFGGNW